MTDKDEARIETLTAEVRVLQVGSRQVTLSMFRQLDWATHTDVEPFGRVKTGDVPPGRPKIGDGASARTKSDYVEIIGSAVGVLVRSVSWRLVLICGSGDWGSLCSQAKDLRSGVDFWQRKGRPPRLRGDYRQYKSATDNWRAHKQPHEWSVYEPDQQTYDTWTALPLILLADP
jgi:hypothetical protein